MLIKQNTGCGPGKSSVQSRNNFVEALTDKTIIDDIFRLRIVIVVKRSEMIRKDEVVSDSCSTLD